ncbi:MAG TPA: EamA family transporter [Patescibacteria group bacterium]|nr:EamA family transporter [Patescibacteria group bacterium]
MSWQILITLSIFLYSSSVLLQRVLLKNNKTDPISFAILFQTGVSLVIGLFVLITKGGINFPNLLPFFWSVVLMTVSYALANIFIFKSLKFTEASSFTVIFSSKTIFAILGASLFLGEKLNFNQWIGSFLILAGVMVVSMRDKLKIKLGEIFALTAAVLFGLANTNDRFLVQAFDSYSYVIIGFLLPAIFITGIYPKKILGIGSMFKEKLFLPKLAILCFLYGFAAVTFFQALQITTNSSQLFSINALSGILTVILSIIFLKEYEFIPRKIIGAALSLVGLLLVS